MFKVALVMFVTIFIWVFSLPLLFLTSIFWLPVGSAMAVGCITFSSWVQWHHQDDIIVESIWRDMIACLKLRTWFKSYKVHWKGDSFIPKNSLIVAHPHGILCCGMLIYHFENKHTVMAVAPVLFYVPVFGWFARSWGLIPATDFMIRKALNEGHSVILYIGGVEELIATCERKLYIQPRWGYLKIINDLKINVISVWVKGEYDTFMSPPLPFLKLRQRLVKYVKVGIMFPWIFGWNSIWMPRPVALDLYIRNCGVSELTSLEAIKGWYHQHLRQTIALAYEQEPQAKKFHSDQVPPIPFQETHHRNPSPVGLYLQK